MSVLIDENDTFKVEFTLGTVGKDTVVAKDKESLLKEYPAAIDTEDHHAVFRQQSYLLDAIILDHSIETVNGQLRMNANLLRVNRLKGLLVSWTLKDDKGVPIAIEDKNIDRLNRYVGNYLSTMVEDALGVV